MFYVGKLSLFIISPGTFSVSLLQSSNELQEAWCALWQWTPVTRQKQQTSTHLLWLETPWEFLFLQLNLVGGLEIHRSFSHCGLWFSLCNTCSESCNLTDLRPASNMITPCVPVSIMYSVAESCLLVSFYLKSNYNRTCRRNYYVIVERIVMAVRRRMVSVFQLL